MEIDNSTLGDITKLRGFTSVYVNNTPVVHIGAVPILMHEVALAGILKGLNMVFIGRSGPGKSQLITDIKYGIFNGDAVHLRGQNELRVRPIYCSVNMELLREGRADEAVKPRAAAFKHLHIMEEFNRAPPPAANEFLAVADGMLDIDGAQIPLGKGERRYAIAIGAANVGNGEFSGTFQTDNALKERLVLALDFDGVHKPNEMDYFNIFEASSDPRVIVSAPTNNIPLLLELNGKITEFASSIDYFVRMMQLYLVKGLDEVTIDSKPYSKEDIPNLGSVVEKDSNAKADKLNYASPPSVRAVKVFGALVPSLAAVAMSKGATSENVIENACYAALELILPFSDSLPKQLLANNRGSRNGAAREMVELVKADMPRSELLEEGIRKANAGKLTAEDINAFNRPRVKCFGRFFSSLNEQALRAKTQGKQRA